MDQEKTKLDTFLAEAEKRARSARIFSLTLTVVPVVIAIAFLYLTVRQVQTAQAQLAAAEDKLQQKKTEIADKETELDELQKRLVSVKNILSNVPAPTLEAAIDKSIESNPSVAETSPVTIYIHIWNESQREEAKQAAEKLQLKGYIVPGIENVGRKAPDRTEVRYFHRTQVEADDARDITRTLQAMSIMADARFANPQGARVRVRRYELWFANEYIVDIKPEPVSSKVLKTTVQYTYDGSEGSRFIYIAVTPLQANGTPGPNTSYSPGPVKSGRGSVVVNVEKTEGDPYTSIRLKVCMVIAPGKDYLACKTFDYTMEWK